jgi:hypothetical protein
MTEAKTTLVTHSHYECARCGGINTFEQPERTIPCPRGGCEAVYTGMLITTRSFIPNIIKQKPNDTGTV